MSIRTHKRYEEQKHIPHAPYRADESWRCPVCGAPSTHLAEADPVILENVRCTRCGFPFSLSTKPLKKGQRHVPVPALNQDWIAAWKIVFREMDFNVNTTLRVMQAINDPMVILGSRERLENQKKDGDA